MAIITEVNFITIMRMHSPIVQKKMKNTRRQSCCAASDRTNRHLRNGWKLLDICIEPSMNETRLSVSCAIKPTQQCNKKHRKKFCCHTQSYFLRAALSELQLPQGVKQMYLQLQENTITHPLVWFRFIDLLVVFRIGELLIFLAAPIFHDTEKTSKTSPLLSKNICNAKSCKMSTVCSTSNLIPLGNVSIARSLIVIIKKSCLKFQDSSLYCIRAHVFLRKYLSSQLV